MKKTIISIIALTSAVALNAQNMWDGVLYSGNDDLGSAKTLGLGNAVSALGGELGTVAFNPAGSAVAGYSQVSFSGAYYMLNQSTGKGVSSTQIKSDMPGVGVTLDFNTGFDYGLKNFTIGIMVHTSNLYQEHGGMNKYEVNASYSGYLAALASSRGAAMNDLLNEASEEGLGAATGIITPASNLGANQYIGVTETSQNGNITSWPTNQSYSKSIDGYKKDYVINLAGNYSDKLYLGGSIVLQEIDYSRTDRLTETPAWDTAADAVKFKSLGHNYYFQAKGDGIYAKAGLIWRPFGGLRIGATYQTPTFLSIEEGWSHATTHKYEDSGSNVKISSADFSSNTSYSIVAPAHFSLAGAYTFGRWGLISCDYETFNNRDMRFKSDYISESEWAESVNNQIIGNNDGDYLGRVNILRLGIELKPVQSLAIRFGYNQTSSTYGYNEPGSYNSFRRREGTNSYTIGVGYDSPRSFYCDIAARFANRSGYSEKLYDDYVDVSINPDIAAPVYTVNSMKYATLVATFGWRF